MSTVDMQNFVFSGPKFIWLSSPSVQKIAVNQLVLDISTHSGDNCNQSLKLSKITPNFACFSPIILLGKAPNFWTCVIKFSPRPIMLQNFAAIDWQSLEILWRNKKNNKTSAGKYKPAVTTRLKAPGINHTRSNANYCHRSSMWHVCLHVYHIGAMCILLKPKFHYADFAIKSGTSSRQSRGHKSWKSATWFVSRTFMICVRNYVWNLSQIFPMLCNGQNSITATQTGLSRTCHRLCRKHLNMSRWFVSATFTETSCFIICHRLCTRLSPWESFGENQCNGIWA